MLIRTVVLLPLQHKLKQKYASVNNRISDKFITYKQNKNISIQDIIQV